MLTLYSTAKRFFPPLLTPSDCSGPSVLQPLRHLAVVRTAVHACPHHPGEVTRSRDCAVSLVCSLLRVALLLLHSSAGVWSVSGRPSCSPRRSRPRGAPHHLRHRRQLPAVALSRQTSFLFAHVGLPAPVGSISRTLGPKNHSPGRMLLWLLQMLPGYRGQPGGGAEWGKELRDGDTR